MRIAIVGGGVSGLVAALRLDPEHEVVLVEAGSRLGGHTRTVSVEREGRRHAVDTGFIVFNAESYPELCRIFRELDVRWHASDMSFGVRCERTGLEYGTSSAAALFAQRRNLLRPTLFRLVRDVRRFYREARDILDSDEGSLTFGEMLARGAYSEVFTERHILPMAAALWSVPERRARELPASHVIRFFENHGMLTLGRRPTWLVVTGGSDTYVRAIRQRLRGRVELDARVRAVRRSDSGVELTCDRVGAIGADEVILACHADQALELIETPTEEERRGLSAFPYTPNEAVLHTDRSAMPRARRAWASWNYRVPAEPRDRATVTYHMNRLQRLEADEDYFVTLNPREGEIPPERILDRCHFHHPTYTATSRSVQRMHSRLVRRNRTSYCGAYWGYGFHEDGVRSALAVARAFDA